MAFPRRLLAEHEDIVLELRPHWIALVFPIFLSVVIIAGMILALTYVPDSWPSWLRWGIFIVAAVLIVAYPVRGIVSWVTSLFVVTTDRLVHRSGWFAKRSMEIPLENINDVHFGQSVFERIIGAGDVVVESAGEYGQQHFSDIRNPEHVQKVIYEESEKNKNRMYSPRGAAPAAAPAGPVSVADELAKLDRLRADGVITQEEFAAQKAKLLGGS
jgi:uncharacterized membrane protein YdbT with pleckstrin-like domain